MPETSAPAPRPRLVSMSMLMARLRALAWVPVVAVVLVVALGQTRIYQLLDALSMDAQAQLVAQAHVFNDALIIDIDDASLRELEPRFGSWPYRRDTYALLVDYLSEMGTRAVVIDLVLSNPREGDAQLRKSIARNGNVVLAASALLEAPSSAQTTESLKSLSWQVPGHLASQAWPSAQLPIPGFTQPAPSFARVGMVSAVPDPDGLLRRLTLFHQIDGALLPTLPLAALFPQGAHPTVGLNTSAQIQIGSLTAPIDPEGAIHLQFPRNASTAVPSMPFHRLADAMLGVPGQALDPVLMRGKTIFVGSSAFFSDRVSTPAGELKGLTIIALAHQQLAHDMLMKPLNRYWTALLFLMALVPSILLLLQPTQSLRSTLWQTLAGALAIYASHLLLLYGLRQESSLLQPLLVLALAALLETWRNWHHDKTELDARIHVLMHDDPLTQLPNRLSMQAHLARLIEQARVHSSSLAVLLIDLDHFNTVNDILSHDTGDQMLIKVANRLRHIIGPAALAARLGGDEFCILVPDTDESGVEQLGRTILNELAQPHHLAGQELHITASIGISLFPHDGLDAASLLKHADTALFHAKDEGRNTSRRFTAALSQIAMEQLLIENQLRHALAHDGELELHYQPQVDMASKKLVAVEALVRWKHPQHGLLFPDHFIPIAEKSDLILALDAWVLRTACQQMRTWHLAGLTHIEQVAVNLSARQFDQSSLPAFVARVLQDTGLAARHLELEITESLAMKNPQHTIATLNALKSMGVTLAVDDFGTGHSSFSYLKLFPISCVKIDRSFVRDIETDNHDAEICSATIALAHKLGLQTVAEGVETSRQFDILKSQQCGKAQGYLISRAVPASGISHFALADIDL